MVRSSLGRCWERKVEVEYDLNDLFTYVSTTTHKGCNFCPLSPRVFYTSDYHIWLARCSTQSLIALRNHWITRCGGARDAGEQTWPSSSAPGHTRQFSWKSKNIGLSWFTIRFRSNSLCNLILCMWTWRKKCRVYYKGMAERGSIKYSRVK